MFSTNNYFVQNSCFVFPQRFESANHTVSLKLNFSGMSPGIIGSFLKLVFRNFQENSFHLEKMLEPMGGSYELKKTKIYFIVSFKALKNKKASQNCNFIFSNENKILTGLFLLMRRTDKLYFLFRR